MKKIISSIIMLTIIIFVIIYDKKQEENYNERVSVTLVNCIDGDTAKINYNGDIVNLRFLAINTKEIGKNEEPYGREASIYTCNMLKNAKKIELEFDKSSDKYDKYGRVLAWIFIDNELLQLNLVKNGYAEVKYIYGDYKYLSILKEAEGHARVKGLGIWGL